MRLTALPAQQRSRPGEATTKLDPTWRRLFPILPNAAAPLSMLLMKRPTLLRNRSKMRSSSAPRDRWPRHWPWLSHWRDLASLRPTICMAPTRHASRVPYCDLRYGAASYCSDWLGGSSNSCSAASSRWCGIVFVLHHVRLLMAALCADEYLGI